MQPTYLPWIGYFALIDLADVFVFLDDVQFDRRSWQQRNKVKGPNGSILLTVPVCKAPRETAVNLIDVSYDQNFPDSHITNIEQNYRKAPYLHEYWRPLRSVLQSRPERLATLNIRLIEAITTQLGLAVDFVRSSELAAKGYKDEYLAAICDELSASVYLSPEGARGYLQGSAAFDSRRISVDYLQYIHPYYPQIHGPFMSHLSVVDLFFNAGSDALDILRSGYTCDDAR